MASGSSGLQVAPVPPPDRVPLLVAKEQVLLEMGVVGLYEAFVQVDEAELALKVGCFEFEVFYD